MSILLLRRFLNTSEEHFLREFTTLRFRLTRWTTQVVKHVDTILESHLRQNIASQYGLLIVCRLDKFFGNTG